MNVAYLAIVYTKKKKAQLLITLFLFVNSFLHSKNINLLDVNPTYEMRIFHSLEESVQFDTCYSDVVAGVSIGTVNPRL